MADKVTITVVREGVGSKEMTIENGASVGELFANFGKLSINGIPADPSDPVHEGDIVTEAKTPKGGN